MPDSIDDRVRRLERLLRRELEAEGLHVETGSENGERLLVIGEMKVFPRRLLDGQIAELSARRASPSSRRRAAGSVDLDWLAEAHRAYFRNLRRFHPSLVRRSGEAVAARRSR